MVVAGNKSKPGLPRTGSPVPSQALSSTELHKQLDSVSIGSEPATILK